MRLIDADAFIGWARTRYCKDCDKRKGMKNGKMRFCYDIGSAPCRACDVDDMVEDVDNFPAAEKWISVKERLPEMGQTVVCAVYGTDLIEQEDGETFVDALRRNRKQAHIELGYLAEDGWNEWEGYPMIVSPSYWMPFPDIPMPEVEE